MLEWFLDLFHYIFEWVAEITFSYDLHQGSYLFYLPFILSIGAFVAYEIIKFLSKQVMK